MSAKNVIAAVVGAGPGLGQALAARFAVGGCDVALLNRSEDSTKAARERVEAAGRRAHFAACDVTDEASVRSAFSSVRDALGGNVDVLVYNVSEGMSTHKPVVQLSKEDMLLSLNCGVMGPMLTAQQVLPGMIKAHRGTILFTSATAAFRGSANRAAFSASRFGMRSLSQTIAKEHAKDGVHVVHVRLDLVIDTGEKLKKMVEEKMGKEMYEQLVPSLAKPDDIAETYFQLYEQTSRASAWSNEVDLRSNMENWTI